MDSVSTQVLAAAAKAAISTLVRASTAQEATKQVLDWAAAAGRTVVDLSPSYGSDLRGELSVGGEPLVSGRALPPWVAAVVEAEGPQLLLLPDVVAASALLPSTNISVLRGLLKDRRLPAGEMPRTCFVVATAAKGEGLVPGLPGDAVMHIDLS